MQGTATKLGSIKIKVAAFVAALLAHAIVLSWQLKLETSSISKSNASTSVLNIELLQPIKKDLESELETPAENNPRSETMADEQPTTVKNKSDTLSEEVSPKVMQTQSILTQEQKEEPTTFVIPSVDSESFQQVIKESTKTVISDSQNVLESFANTFVAPTPQAEIEIKDETGPLGGGSYKVRNKDFECETLKMVPQSFDDFNGGTISTKGKCRRLKSKFNLVDKDGKIRNSNRQD